MKIDDRFSTSVCADEKMYVDNADYRSFIVERIQNELSKQITTALFTKGAIVAIKGDNTTRKDEITCGIICRQDVYVKELVRCKDCKHHEDEEVDMVYCPDIVGCWVDNNFFCADGERKDEVEE